MANFLWKKWTRIRSGLLKLKLPVTTGHTQLPRRGVAEVGSFGQLAGNPTRKRP